MPLTKGPYKISGPSSGKSAMDDGGDYAIYVERDGERYIIAEAFHCVADGVTMPALELAQSVALVPALVEFVTLISSEPCNLFEMNGPWCPDGTYPGQPHEWCYTCQARNLLARLPRGEGGA